MDECGLIELVRYNILLVKKFFVCFDKLIFDVWDVSSVIKCIFVYLYIGFVKVVFVVGIS